ncbi:MAG: hypothetical protein ACOYOU_04215 [Kiritimatiellia bacterium]
MTNKIPLFCLLMPDPYSLLILFIKQRFRLPFAVSCFIFVCFCNVIAVDLNGNNEKDKITAIYDDASLCSILQDVSCAYGIRYIAVFRDPYRTNSSDGVISLYTKEKSPLEFFCELQKLCPAYTFTQDVQTGCWFVYPADEKAAGFFDTVSLPDAHDSTAEKAVQTCMRTMPNAYQIPNKHIELSREPMRIWPYGWRQHLWTQGVKRDWNGETCIRWNALAQILTNISRSFMVVYMSAPVDLISASNPTQSVISCFWTIGNSLDYLGMNDEELVRAIQNSINDNTSQDLIRQLSRVDDGRLWRIYKKLDWRDKNIV